MLVVYFNYPNPRITVHADPGCSFVPRDERAPKRSTRITLANLSQELQAFADQRYRFQAMAGLNDLWLVIDLGDQAFERAVVEYIQGLLSRRYAPFGRVTINSHCVAEPDSSP
jgi:hypothetical protein